MKNKNPKSDNVKDVKNNNINDGINWQQKAEEYLNGWKRAKADFINYKNRQNEIMTSFREYVKESFIIDILPVLDSFEEAVKHIPESEKESEWVRGIMGIKSQINELLKNNGVETIKTIGEEFDPKSHEGIGIVESDEKSGIIIEELQKGYMLNGKIIRAAKVKISK